MATYESGVLRSRPRINVLRGYPGNEPTSITAALPVDSTVDHSTTAKTILSGQPIWRNAAGNFTNLLGTGWGDTNGADAKNVQDIFFAYHDSTDTDVTSCGKLLGFSALGKFELETPWFDDNVSISVGDALGINDAGLLRQLSTGASGSGAVVGYCTGIRDLGIGGHTALGGGGIVRGGVQGTIPEDSTADTYTPAGGSAGNWVITFVTSIA
jgi:hypothetical protein